MRMPPAGLDRLILPAARHGRVPILQTMHGWGIAKSPAQQQADVAILNLVDRVVVPAEASAALLESIGVARERIRVSPMAFRRARARVGEPHPVEAEMRAWQRGGGRVACCSGTLGERKNQRLLVDALALLAPDPPLAVRVRRRRETTICGRTPSARRRRAVRFCGYAEDARHIAAAADFLVLPSLSEGSRSSILEAFCDGVPVLASAIPEIREMIEDGVTGLLFDPPTRPISRARWRRAPPHAGRRERALRARAHGLRGALLARLACTRAIWRIRALLGGRDARA